MAAWLKSTARNPPAKPPSRSRSSRKRSAPAVSLLLSTPNMRSTLSMPANSAWIPTISSSPSLITVSRRSKSPKRLSAPVPSISLSSILLPLSCPRPNSTAKWATPTSACRHASCRRRSASSPAPQPGDNHRRPRAQVLLLRTHRHPPHRRCQGGRGRCRLAHEDQDRQEQGRRALPRSRVRHPLRRRHLARRRRARSRSRQ